jgi:sensor histidine kinase regulating citrate/malate metabolism
MTEHLHVLRHDYKYHLASMLKMLEEGYHAEAKEYLAKLDTDDNSVYEYCKSKVLNALLVWFSERCEHESISFTVKIELPPALTIDDYELCVIIGNLLENAVTACVRTPNGQRRYIELSMRPRAGQYGIKAENSYDGILRHEDKELYSTKPDGGFGINSIKAIANRHSGEYIPVWDNEKFEAFVILKLC